MFTDWDALGTPRGKIGNRVWRRDGLTRAINSYLLPERPRRRTIAQERAVQAFTAATQAWQRLSPEQLHLWRTNPPPVVLRRRNRGANSDASTGWNRFISHYIQEVSPMEYARLELAGPLTLPAYDNHVQLAILFPQPPPPNLLVRASALGRSTSASPARWLALKVQQRMADFSFTLLSDHSIQTVDTHARAVAVAFRYSPPPNLRSLELVTHPIDADIIVSNIVFTILY